MTRMEMRELTEEERKESEQLRTAELLEKDEALALVAINSFITAFELLRSAS